MMKAIALPTAHPTRFTSSCTTADTSGDTCTSPITDHSEMSLHATTDAVRGRPAIEPAALVEKVSGLSSAMPTMETDVGPRFLSSAVKLMVADWMVASGGTSIVVKRSPMLLTL